MNIPEARSSASSGSKSWPTSWRTSEPPRVSPRDVWLARTRIRALVRRTTLLPAGELAEHLWIVDETRQPTASFKIRGAASALSALSSEELARGVVAVSTGNHGRAVAHVARALGTTATVFVSDRVPPNKLEALTATGADTVVTGDSQDDAEDAARAHAAEHGSTLVPPFDNPAVIAGQGTLGLELLDELPRIRTVVVPLSGGGLIAGVALALKSVDPRIRVVGVSMEHGAVMYASLRAGHVVEMPEADTLADSLQGGLGRDNSYTLRAVQELVDETLLVPESAIAAAMRHAFRHHRLVLEGAGAAALAAVMIGEVDVDGETAVIASGGNVAANLYARVLQGYDGPLADGSGSGDAASERDAGNDAPGAAASGREAP